jgi:hypothetical protein
MLHRPRPARPSRRASQIRRPATESRSNSQPRVASGITAVAGRGHSSDSIGDPDGRVAHCFNCCTGSVPRQATVDFGAGLWSTKLTATGHGCAGYPTALGSTTCTENYGDWHNSSGVQRPRNTSAEHAGDSYRRLQRCASDWADIAVSRAARGSLEERSALTIDNSPAHLGLQ